MVVWLVGWLAGWLFGCKFLNLLLPEIDDNNQASQTSLHKINLEQDKAAAVFLFQILFASSEGWVSGVKMVNYQSNIQLVDWVLRHARAGEMIICASCMVANSVSCMFIPNCLLDYKCIQLPLGACWIAAVVDTSMFWKTMALITEQSGFISPSTMNHIKSTFKMWNC